MPLRAARLVLLSASFIVGVQVSQLDAQQMPTVVLVHGAFAESSSWNGVVSRLLAKGYPVVAAANPLRGIYSDAEYVRTVLATVQGPVVLVGHSYGGAVISAAAAGSTKVRALVFVGAFAPDAGETLGELNGKFPGSTLGPTLTPPAPLPGGGNDLYIQQAKFHAQFAADVPRAEALVMAATQRPIVDSAFVEHTGIPAWKSLPSWFIYGEKDLNIPAAAHAFMAGRAKAKETVSVPGSSHVVMVSHPDAVATVIEHAAGAR